MKKIILLFSLVGIVSCTTQELSSNSEVEGYAEVFNEIDHLLSKDDGLFWDYSLKGPILLVDPVTRQIISNQNNNAETFQAVEGVYLDTLPAEINIANTALNWDEKRWTMVMLPLPTEKKARNNLIIHELFHRIQPQIGYDNLVEASNAHLDTYHGRILLKLELEALMQAINSVGEARATHIANAIRFRTERHTTKEILQAENTLECNEGLAEYTGVMLSGRDTEELKTHFKNSVHLFYKNKTFVRSFAYHTIPIYGYLLSEINNDWHKEITKTTNLTEYINKAFSPLTDSTTSYEIIAKQHDYSFEKIQKEEQLRAQKQEQIIAGYKELFLDQPSLKLNFQKMHITFDPGEIVPIKEIGTVYPNLRVTDNWGILEVKNGALIDINWQFVIVSKPDKIDTQLIKGDGWSLQLNDGWMIKKANKNYELTYN